jgi:hypothetical protein
VKFQIGDRVGVVGGNLIGYYGHVTDRVISPKTLKPISMVGVTLRGHRAEEDKPRLGQEWFIPTKYLEHAD